MSGRFRQIEAGPFGDSLASPSASARISASLMFASRSKAAVASSTPQNETVMSVRCWDAWMPSKIRGAKVRSAQPQLGRRQDFEVVDHRGRHPCLELAQGQHARRGVSAKLWTVLRAGLWGGRRPMQTRGSRSIDIERRALRGSPLGCPHKPLAQGSAGGNDVVLIKLVCVTKLGGVAIDFGQQQMACQ